jgi:hypothetical protein
MSGPVKIVISCAGADRLISLSKGPMGLRLPGAAIGIAHFVWVFTFGEQRGWMAPIEAVIMSAPGAPATEPMQPSGGLTDHCWPD